ncbi:MAG TPA: hypothetical protein VH142_10490 [Polyangiaceae bacterium]|nr:hypothetical protein [Polyangiaceae bacterium]
MKPASRPRAITVCLLLGLLLWPSLASAQRIVLLRPKTADPALLQAFGRLKGELMVHDFEVLVVDADDDSPSPAELAAAAERVRAVASVSLVRSLGLASADVWISDRVTGKTSMRTIATAQQTEASNVLAVRAVDLLRTSLREFGPGDRPPPDVVGASPERAPEHVRVWATATAQSPPTKQRWSIDAGVVFQSTLSRLGTVYGPSIALDYAPTERFALGLGFQGPLAGAHASQSGASLALRNEQLFAEVGYRLFARGIWSIAATGAAGAHHLDVQGTAGPGYAGRSDSAWTALFSAGFGAALELTRGAALEANARGLLLTPRPVARVADADLPYGRPALQAGAGLHVSF